MSPVLLQCPECALEPALPRWLRHEGAPRTVVEDGVAVRFVAGVPEWAVAFALQGVAVVTRYSCPQCKRELAVLARDLERAGGPSRS